MNPPDSSRQFARLTYEAIFARAVGLLGGFAANIMIARSLGAGGKGLLTTLAVWSGLLASLFSVGIHLATVYELGARPWHARRLYSFVLPYVSGATLLLGSVYFLFRNRIGHPELPLLFLVLLFSAQLLCNLAFALLIGLRNQSAVNWLQVAGAVCYPALVGVILVLRNSLDVAMVALCMVVMPVMSALFALILLKKKTIPQVPAGPMALQWAGFLRYALKSTAMATGSLLYSQIVMLIISAGGNPAQVGVFSVAMIFMDTATVIPAMIASFVLPRWAGLPNSEVLIRACRVIRLTHPISLVIAVGAAFLAMVLAGPVFGKDFSGVGMLALIMVPGAWAATGITVISYSFLSQNRHVIPLSLAWLGTLLSGGLAWWCLPKFGCAGAAMAVTLSRLIVLLWAWASFARANREAPRPMWIPGRQDVQAWGQIVRHSLIWIRCRT